MLHQQDGAAVLVPHPADGLRQLRRLGIRLGLVRTFQNVEVIKELTLIDNVLIGAHTDFKATILVRRPARPG